MLKDYKFPSRNSGKSPNLDEPENVPVNGKLHEAYVVSQMSTNPPNLGLLHGGSAKPPAQVPHFDLKEDPSFWTDHNVQVLVRIRPLTNMELNSYGYGRCLNQESAQCVTFVGHPETRFTFDHVACETIDQETLFRMVGLPMVENCLSGYNSCIFAYGQTGSGKTHTMLGEINELEVKPSPYRGLIPRIFEFLYARIIAEEESRVDERLTYNCKCSYLEIYNEQITDLLDPSSTNLQLREDVKKGVYVENLTEIDVHTVGDILRLLSRGSANRRVAATNMNRESSRSHCVFTCVIESRWDKDSTSNLRFARLNLVDLAGSERQKTSGAEGERLKEASKINKSLSTLGHVIMVLEDAANARIRHIPYRNSRLTFLLQDSLGGNSKTMMIANVSPSICSATETLNTLKFAQRAKLIQNNAVVNEDASGDVMALQHQIQLLKEELAILKKQNVSRALTFGPKVTEETREEHENDFDNVLGHENEFLSVSSKQEAPNDTKENTSLRLELEKSHEELEKCKNNLISCLEQNAKLCREIEDLNALLEKKSRLHEHDDGIEFKKESILEASSLGNRSLHTIQKTLNIDVEHSEADVMINELLIANETMNLDLKAMKKKEVILINERDMILQWFETDTKEMKKEIEELKGMIFQIHSSVDEYLMPIASDFFCIKSRIQDSSKLIQSWIEDVWSEIIAKDGIVSVLRVCLMGILLEMVTGLNAENRLLYHGLCESSSLVSQLREHNCISRNELEMCRKVQGKLLADIKNSFDRVSKGSKDTDILSVKLASFEEKILNLHSEMERKEAVLEGLKTSLEVLEGELLLLQESSSNKQDQKAEIEELKASLEVLISENMNLRSEIERKEAVLEGLQGSMEVLELELLLLQESSSNKHEQKAENEELEASLEVLEDELNENNVKRQVLESQLKDEEQVQVVALSCDEESEEQLNEQVQVVAISSDEESEEQLKEQVASQPYRRQPIVLVSGTKKIVDLNLGIKKVDLMKDSIFGSLTSITNKRESSATLIEVLCKYFNPSNKVIELNKNTPFSFCTKEIAEVIGMDNSGIDYLHYLEQYSDPSSKFPPYLVNLKAKFDVVAKKGISASQMKNILREMPVDDDKGKRRFRKLIMYYIIEQVLLCCSTKNMRGRRWWLVKNLEACESINWPKATEDHLYSSMENAKTCLEEGASHGQHTFIGAAPVLEAIIYERIPKMRPPTWSKTFPPIQKYKSQRRNTCEWIVGILSQLTPTDILPCPHCNAPSGEE